MTLNDFNKAVHLIVAQEFADVVQAGLLTEEVLTSVTERMCETIHKTFPEMTETEEEYHLRLLREKCRETARKIEDLLPPQFNRQTVRTPGPCLP